MELANLWRGGLRGRSDTGIIRTATDADEPAISELLRRATYSHIHADWYLPVHWLGRSEFLVYQVVEGENSFMRKMWGDDVSLRACLVAIADPLPVAWVRVAAIRGLDDPISVLAAMLERLEGILRETAVTRMAWMPVGDWPDDWLRNLGFNEISQIETYHKCSMALSKVEPISDFFIRPAVLEDIPYLVEVEIAAFAPIWRYSLNDLTVALGQSASFDVAVLKGQIVGFQLSTCHNAMAHLARLTVLPTLQGQGIGSALLAYAIEGYKRQHVHSVSLNTQVDNVASQYLYRKFGFVAQKQRFSIWAKQVQ